MEKMWSPWRSQYIDSLNDKDKTDACVFCEKQKKDCDIPESLLIAKNKLTFTILNLYPYNNGHLMVIPYRHTSDFLSLTTEENSEILLELQKAKRILDEVYHPEGFNIGANLGKVGGAGIFEHLHFHIVPRWNGDTNFMPVLGEVKILSQDLLDSQKRLRAAYLQLFGSSEK
jgi:ATP adenylyltransferase